MADKDRTYKCLNPVGMLDEVETFPLAPRLEEFDGKTLYFSASGEPDIMIPLEKKLREQYPNVNWKKKQTYSTDVDPLSKEEMEECDGLVQGVAW